MNEDTERTRLTAAVVRVQRLSSWVAARARPDRVDTLPAEVMEEARLALDSASDFLEEILGQDERPP